jgi:hypothetical protein
MAIALRAWLEDMNRHAEDRLAAFSTNMERVVSAMNEAEKETRKTATFMIDDELREGLEGKRIRVSQLGDG